MISNRVYVIEIQHYNLLGIVITLSNFKLTLYCSSCYLVTCNRQVCVARICRNVSAKVPIFACNGSDAVCWCSKCANLLPRDLLAGHGSAGGALASGGANLTVEVSQVANNKIAGVERFSVGFRR
jgi:hypothetical protein